VHENAIAGAAAGAATAFLTCPLDVARTRYQVQHKIKGTTPKYHGLLQTFSLILREEGLLSFFKGLGPQLFGLVPSWAIYFTVYDRLKSVITKASNDRFNPSVVHLMSAVGAGAVTNLGTTPFFVIKTRLQTQLAKKDSNGNGVPQYKGTYDAFKKIAKTEGLLTLWSGLLPSMIGLVHVAIQFPLYEKFKSMIVTRKPDPTKPLSVGELFVCAAGSKVFASAVAYPHEVIRSRLQDQGHGFEKVEKRYKGVTHAVKTIVKHEGAIALYQGLGITLLRTVPASMITLTVYEETLRFVRRIAE